MILELAALLVSAPGAALGTGADRDSAAALADLAVKANPDISAVMTRLRALQQRVTAAGAWRDPVLSFNYQNMPAGPRGPRR